MLLKRKKSFTSILTIGLNDVPWFIKAVFGCISKNFLENIFWCLEKKKENTNLEKHKP